MFAVRYIVKRVNIERRESAAEKESAFLWSWKRWVFIFGRTVGARECIRESRHCIQHPGGEHFTHTLRLAGCSRFLPSLSRALFQLRRSTLPIRSDEG